jgi:hypothetical protein
MKKKTQTVEVETFSRFIKEMAEVFDLPPGKLERLMFQNEPRVIRNQMPPSGAEKNDGSSKALTT